MNGNLDVSDLSIDEPDLSISLGDPKIHKLVRRYRAHLKKLPEFKHKTNLIKQALGESASKLKTERFLALNKLLSRLEQEVENFEFQLEESVDLDLDDNVWDGQIVADEAEATLENYFTKYELVVDDIKQLENAQRTPYENVDGSDHRLEIGNSTKHRVGGWQPDQSGVNEYMAYGLFRNQTSVKAKSRVTSTSIVLVKNDADHIISFDVEREFEYTWGFGRQKGNVYHKTILMDFLSARSSKVTISAYVTNHSLLAEYVVAKKCLEIMDETTTRLAFEFEGFEDSITKQRADSEREDEEAERLRNQKLDGLNKELVEALAKMSQLGDELDQKQSEVIQLKEDYGELIEDVLDEIADIINCQDDSQFLYQSETLPHERSRLRNTFIDIKRQLISESKKLEEYESINKATNDQLDEIKAALVDAKSAFEGQNELKDELEKANEKIARLEKMGDDTSVIDEIRSELRTAKEAFENEQKKLEENHLNEVSILETTIAEKQTFIENLETKLKSLEEENERLAKRENQAKEDALKNEQLIIESVEEKVRHMQETINSRLPDPETLLSELHALRESVVTAEKAWKESSDVQNELTEGLVSTIAAAKEHNENEKNNVLSVEKDESVENSELATKPPKVHQRKTTTFLVVCTVATIIYSNRNDIVDVVGSVLSQTSDFVESYTGINTKEHAKVIWLPVERGISSGLDTLNSHGSHHYQVMSDSVCDLYSAVTKTVSNYVPAACSTYADAIFTTVQPVLQFSQNLITQSCDLCCSVNDKFNTFYSTLNDKLVDGFLYLNSIIRK